MKKRCYPKRVNPKLMLTHFSEMFKSVGLKKPAFRNLLLTILGVCVAKTFRINEIASRLPIVVATEKSKQKRLLRFLETSLPLGDIQRAYFACVVGRLWPDETSRKLFLVDETDLIRGWKVIVAAIAFRHRAIPVLWLLYKDKEIQHGKYKSHNEIVQRFCLKLYELAVSSAPQAGRLEPILVFDRGFARAQYVIKFLKDREIPFILRVCRTVGIRYQGSEKKLDDFENKFHASVLYHKRHQIPVELYVRRNNPKDPMYLISNGVCGHQLYQCYKRRMQIEHGFRDIKSRFGFGQLVLKKPTRQRVAILWLLACLAYALLFLSYEKAATRWAKAFNGRQKRYSVITVITRVIRDLWHREYLVSFFGNLCFSRDDIYLGIH